MGEIVGSVTHSDKQTLRSSQKHPSPVKQLQCSHAQMHTHKVAGGQGFILSQKHIIHLNRHACW